jgi:hypothetical protein
MSVEKAKRVESSDDSQIIADVVLAEDTSLDEEHKNAGGAPVEDQSPIGQDVGWWTAVFLSTFIFDTQFALAEPTAADFSQMIGTGMLSLVSSGCTLICT